MDSVFNEHGQPVAWIYRNYIYNIDGSQVLAYIYGGAVFNESNLLLGFFNDGYIRDFQGNGVAFVEGAGFGPQQPTSRIHIVPPTPRNPTFLPNPSLPPIPPLSTWYWSSLTWNNFINQQF